MIRIAIIGYGNLGRACERIAIDSEDMEIFGIFTRREPSSLSSPYGTRFFRQSDIEQYKAQIDVACICTGSANDVTELAGRLAKSFNTVDSFDTHSKMIEYADDMRKSALEGDRLCFIGIGWDPGLFSLMRALFDGVLPCGNTQTFWGRGVSQGHSEAIRRIEGVKDAKQYTVPKEDALKLARDGKGSMLTDRDRHLRECYVVAEDGADKDRIKREIVTMPNYFEPYDTIVHFIDENEFRKKHSSMAHAGFVTRGGRVNDTAQSLEFSLKLDSNPDFTASVLMAYARANAKLYAAGERGVRTILDIPVSALLDGCFMSNVRKYV